MSSSARILTRSLVRQHAFGAGIGLTLGGAAIALHQPRVRFDTRPAARAPLSAEPPASKGSLDPELLKQMSGGSMAGFLSGLLVSVFSRTLVLVMGLAVVAIQVASRYGIDLIQQLKLKQRIGNSRVLEALEKNPAFKLSFGAFFAMSAFMSF